MIKDLLLGIDIGTTGTKCSFYDLEGYKIASAYQEYPMLHPHPNWSEQDPNRWWSAVCENLQKCFREKKIDNRRVAAVGISCTNAVVLVDDKGRPVSNAIGLHDQRSEQQLEWLKERISPEEVLQRTGNRLAKGSFALPRLKWFQDNMPDELAGSYKFLTPGGFIIQHLTGKFIINHSRANLTLLSNIHTAAWDGEILEKSEFPERLLPDNIPGCTVAGCVNAEAAELTGLLEGTPVSAGSVDTVAATLAAGAVNPGDMAITIGSSGRICCISEKPIIDERLLNCESPCEGMWTIIQTTDNAGVSLRWFRDVFGKSICSDPMGPDYYRLFDETAASTAPGADGLIYLPYLAGEQSPIWNPSARGIFWGMGLENNFGNFARALLEGVAYSIKDCMNVVLEKTPEPSYIPIGGGVANSDIWCRIFADVLGYPVAKIDQSETETFGDAVVAARSVGLPMEWNIGTHFTKDGLIYPDEKYRDMYEEQFRKYKAVYNLTRELL